MHRRRHRAGRRRRVRGSRDAERAPGAPQGHGALPESERSRRDRRRHRRVRQVTDAGANAEASSEQALDAFYGALLEDDPVALYERAPCGYLSTLPDGTIIKANETFFTLTGYARADVVGRRRFSELLTPGGRIYHETHYAPMLQMQGSAGAIALEIVRADGTRLPVLVNAVLERAANGDPTIVRTAIFDATDRREYER